MIFTNTNFLIIGLGLLGGSIAKKIKSIQNENINNIFSLSHKNETLNLAKQLNLTKYSDTNLTNLISKIIPKENILIIIATPPNLVFKNFLNLLDNLKVIKDKNIIITDISSVKSKIYNEIKIYLPYHKNISFVGSHPMAGKENAGLINSEENLLDNSITFITPLKDLNDIKYKNDLLFVCKFWKELNTKPIIIKDDKHDEIVALSSHFQHILSAINIKLASENKNNLFPFAIGGSFNSNTRIAKSDPFLWTDIILKNKENVLNILNEYKNLFQTFENFLLNEDKAKILSFLQSAQKEKIFLDDKINKIKNLI